MSKKLRFLVILSLILSFFVLAPLLILYSQGYHFYLDPESNRIKITQTGGIAIKVNPNGASVFLNGEFTERTSLLSSSVYINNLKPQKYNIKVEMESYYPWEKNLNVEEKHVAEAKNILLIPRDLEFRNLTSATEDFWIISEKEIILKEYSPEEEWSLKIFDLENNLKSHLISEKEISSKKPALLGLKYSSDLEEIILKIDLKERMIFYIIDLKQSSPELTPLDFLEIDIEEVEFNPQNPETLFFFRNGTLSQTNISGKNPQIVLQEITAYQFVQNNIYYLKDNGYICKNNLLFNSEQKLNNTPFSLKEKAKYQIKTINDYIFLLENDLLYFLNPVEEIFKKLSEKVKEIRFSTDSQKVVFFNNYEIWVFFLEEQKSQPKKEAFSKQLLIRFSEEINDVFWLNSYYLIFNLEKKIKVIEIDDRDKINSYEIFSSELSLEKLNWDFVNKSLYFLSDKKIFLSIKLDYL